MPAKEPQVLDFPLHIPTPETRQWVEQMVANGIEHDSICYIIKATPYELKLHYENEVKYGMASATAQVAGAVFRAGIEGDMKAATFWLRSRAGWRDAVAPKTDADAPAQVAADKQHLIDKIVGLLTPAQAVEVLKSEASPVAQGVAKPGPTLN
jgi:hypothetical protein